MESAYNTSNATIEELVDSLLERSALNYVGYRAFIRGVSAGASKERKYVELANMVRQKELAFGQDWNHLHRATRNGACISAVPHCLNGTELSREEFQDNFRLRYGLMPQDIPMTCDGCYKRFLIEHAL